MCTDIVEGSPKDYVKEQWTGVPLTFIGFCLKKEIYAVLKHPNFCDIILIAGLSETVICRSYHSFEKMSKLC